MVCFCTRCGSAKLCLAVFAFLQYSVLPAENGPYHINDDLSLNRSEYGWDVNSNMIFVDQPINTGFSYSDVSLKYRVLLPKSKVLQAAAALMTVIEYVTLITWRLVHDQHLDPSRV